MSVGVLVERWWSGGGVMLEWCWSTGWSGGGVRGAVVVEWWWSAGGEMG